MALIKIFIEVQKITSLNVLMFFLHSVFTKLHNAHLNQTLVCTAQTHQIGTIWRCIYKTKPCLNPVFIADKDYKSNQKDTQISKSTTIYNLTPTFDIMYAI